ncbi:branched-chain amino acid ABC transporter permease [Alsobacter metallidurans]|uniref:Branched-chain amino acid ABC transporter permease n=1 Tax=Alsobacter metallidurans TaxID=340221 RepID=A0A917MIA4_9HYPH|nr:branched-chain amino acid ABC transporter permease [Alsobacter metallidurans]GGH22727.1 branched-chain amino acid ABC transporter permease [Alsobacter metallidurans]
MSFTLLTIQILNGLQLGLLLFLVAAGLTLVFGVMDFINLAHGVQYMVGAYLAAALIAYTGSFALGLVLALAGALAIGLVMEGLIFRHLYGRSHLDQVLATFGLILVLNEGVKMIWGAAPISVGVPEALQGSVSLGDGVLYPVYRFAIIAAGLAVAAGLWLVIDRTRIGMLVRAGASNAPIVSALGVDINRLFMIVFACGAMLAGFAGAMAAPILSVEPGMGDSVLILAFVVIVIGGIGSIRGAFAAALIVGLLDTLGRSYSVDLLRLFLPPAAARGVAGGLSSMFIYILMAVVLFFRPEGLLPARGRS